MNNCFFNKQYDDKKNHKNEEKTTFNRPGFIFLYSRLQMFKVRTPSNVVLAKTFSLYCVSSILIFASTQQNIQFNIHALVCSQTGSICQMTYCTYTVATYRNRC